MTLDDLINLDPDEEIAMKLRRHWLVFLGTTMMVLLLAAVPFGAGYVILGVRPGWLNGSVSRPLLILLASAYYLNIWLFALSVFTDYYLDSWIVTNRRVMDILQSGLFGRTVSELELNKIQDVTSEVKGIIPSMFDFGDVHIQTAGEEDRFTFEQIPHAHRVRHQLIELVNKNRQQMASQSKTSYNPLHPID